MHIICILCTIFVCLRWK